MPRSRGEGSITQRKDGRWQASLQIAGVRRTVYGKTRKEAAEKLQALRQQAIGGLPDPGKRTVTDLFTSWLETAEPTLKPSTLCDYKYITNEYILPALGNIRLSSLEPILIERLCGSILTQGHARTASLVYTLVHRACTFGVRWHWLLSNPCDRVPRPQYRAKRKEMWTPEELRTFLAGASDHWLYPLWYLAIATGARMGELLALTWDDVDLEAGTVRISKTLRHIAGQAVVYEPKTCTSNRTVAIPAAAIQVLKGLPRKSNFVFTGRHGQPLHITTVEHALKRTCAHLGLPPISPHGLRHLHASLLLDQKVPLPIVSARLGHADPSITARIYSHVIGNRDDAAAQAIAQALK